MIVYGHRPMIFGTHTSCPFRFHSILRHSKPVLFKCNFRSYRPSSKNQLQKVKFLVLRTKCSSYVCHSYVCDAHCACVVLNWRKRDHHTTVAISPLLLFFCPFFAHFRSGFDKLCRSEESNPNSAQQNYHNNQIIRSAFQVYNFQNCYKLWNSILR